MKKGIKQFKLPVVGLALFATLGLWSHEMVPDTEPPDTFITADPDKRQFTPYLAEDLQPVEEIIEKKLLTRSELIILKSCLEHHDWERFVDQMVDRRHFNEQMRIGMTPPDYIADVLGLNYVDNDLGAAAEAPDDYSSLERIVRVTYGALEETDDGFYVHGVVYLDDGRELRLELYFNRSGDRYVISGGVG